MGLREGGRVGGWEGGREGQDIPAPACFDPRRF